MTIQPLDEQFTADITELVDKHGCAQFLQRDLAPVAQLRNAIERLRPVAGGSAEKACLRDLRKLLKKYEHA